MNRHFDAIVVGAGPAGSSAALAMASAGLDVALLERGNFPGEKNMFGGVLHRLNALEEYIPDIWNHAPLERHIVKKSLSFLTPSANFTINYDDNELDTPPYNGYTIFRPRFDRWLAEQAVKAGATLIPRTTVDELILENGSVVGIRALRDNSDLYAPILIAADGALSFVARKAGLRRPRFRDGDMAIGIKALIDMPKEVIDDRFGLTRDQGASNEIVGCTSGVRGGSFLYTNYDSLSLGMVLHTGSLAASGYTAYELLNNFMNQPQIAKMLRGGKLLEYSAHLVPEGGYEMMPQLCGDGILVTGDAAGFCVVTGMNLEGINHASQSGILAGKAAVQAHQRGKFDKANLASYRALLEQTPVLQDLKLYRRTPGMLHNDRIYSEYPEFVCGIMDSIYRINGIPKSNMTSMIMRNARQTVGLRNLLADVYAGWRAL